MLEKEFDFGGLDNVASPTDRKSLHLREDRPIKKILSVVVDYDLDVDALALVNVTPSQKRSVDINAEIDAELDAELEELEAKTSAFPYNPRISILLEKQSADFETLLASSATPTNIGKSTSGDKSAKKEKKEKRKIPLLHHRTFIINGISTTISVDERIEIDFTVDDIDFEFVLHARGLRYRGTFDHHYGEIYDGSGGTLGRHMKCRIRNGHRVELFRDNIPPYEYELGKESQPNSITIDIDSDRHESGTI